ncbi:hypothetical protein CHS0354_017672 [Potamilus streckersoni]|uniref:protein-lysine 6-oxidase n=1 Tax=Potamilus streckersoni TaxID=2493646 RepID=A0AAE0S7R6_9BIVA|nr:hypothetical protein CHS0354_017672 [Potamilus streckersoni]
MTKFLWKIIRVHIFLHLWLCLSKVDADPRWLEGEVRLVGGKDVNEGTVLIYHNGTWGIVCHDNWDLRDANVVCRQMGYPGANKAVKNSQFGRGRRQVWMSGVHCRGNEFTLSRCYFRGWGRYHQNDCDGRWVSAGAICNKRDSMTTTSNSTSSTTTTTKTPKPTTTTTTTTTPRPTTTTTTTTRKPTTTTTTRKTTTTTTTHKPTTTTTTPKPITTTTSARQRIPQSARRRPVATEAPRERPLTFLNIISANPEQINSRRRGPVIIPTPGDEDSGSNGGEGSENIEVHGENEAAGVTRVDTFIQPDEMLNEVNAKVEEKPITVQTVESEDEEIKNEINERPTENTTEQRQFDVWIYDNSSHRYIMYRNNGDIVTSPPDPKLFTVRSGWNEADTNRDTKNNENGNSKGEENGQSGGDDASQNSSSSSSYSDSSSDSDSEATEAISASLRNNGGDKGDEDSANAQQANARLPEDDSGGNEKHEDEQSAGTITVQEAQRAIIQQQHSINQMRNEIQREGNNITRLQGEIDRASERIVNNTEARTELREEQRVVEYMREEITHENEQINQLQHEVDEEREVIQDARQPVVEDQRIQQVSTNLNHGREGMNEVIQNIEVQLQDVRLRVSDVRNGSINTNQRDRNTNHIDDKYNDIYLADDPRKLKPVAELLISNHPTSPPPTYTEFRLEGGRVHGEGRIDMRLAGSNKWGTICGDSWGIREAIVACRHFGVGYARIAVTRSYYGGANMDKVLAGLKCTGKEQRLDECNFVMTNGEPGQVACARADSVAGISCTNYLADLIPNVTRLEQSAFLQDRYLYYLQCAMEENCLAESARDIYKQPRWTSHTRRLFRFSTIAHNHGNADFRPELERHNWQWHACHQHYHSMDVFAHYDITDRHGNRVAEGMKASFCLEDSECQHGVKPKYDCNFYGEQGLTVGCSDNYLADIDCQWIDVTDLKPGLYKFQMAINPRLRVPEMSFENNVVSCDLYYNSYHAQLSKCELTGLL